MLGAAILACELAGLPWSAIHLSKLKVHAIGKGNAKKPDMQAAAKARWGKDLGEDEVDAAWAGAYANGKLAASDERLAPAPDSQREKSEIAVMPSGKTVIYCHHPPNSRRLSD
jgi:Holliday junction resolvasome RuvABC endonuclease subunit